MFYDFVKITGGIPGFLFFRPKLLYANDAAKERVRGGALLIANHFGFFDPIYLQFALWYRRMRFVCLKQFFDSKAGWLFYAVHCIPVDRENIGMDTVREIVDSLKKDEVVGMFPEGQINTEPGDLAAFKSGMVLMGLQSKKPIIPVYIKPRYHWYDRLVLAIGEPVDVGNMGASGMAALDEAAKLLHDREEELKKLAGGLA